jgi:hypothetical protein
MLGEAAGHEVVVGDLAEDVEVGNAAGPGARLDRGHERLPELGIHVLGGVDAEAIDTVAVDPAAEDLDHPAITRGFSVIRSSKVRRIAHPAALAAEGRVAAVVVKDRVVEPGRDLDVALGGRDLHRVRKIRGW